MAPLDWGIGHATRCVPVIRALLKNGAEVTIAASGRPLEYLKGYFPDLTFAEAPGIKVRYPSRGSMLLKMILSLPGFLTAIIREHRWLDRYVAAHHVDAVISDNRFGFWSHRVPSVYITHQLTVKMPVGLGFMEPVAGRAHRFFIRRYKECWIPDYEGEENLSGELSHRWPRIRNAHFIGPLTRFDGQANEQQPVRGPDLLVILSGPEPQRTILETIILSEILKKPGLRTVLLRGTPGENITGRRWQELTVFPHLPDKEMASLVKSSRHILCRPGYSTLMDLATLGRKAILVPTPGQTEQEYLAKYLSGKYGFIIFNQKKFRLDQALAESSGEKEALLPSGRSHYLENRISLLLDGLG